MWPLELGLGTRNPRFVAWPLELGLGTRNPLFVAWPLELGLGTRNPRFVVWPLELGGELLRHTTCRKGHGFYNRLCRLDGVKAKDGQRNYSSGSAYQRLRGLIVDQGRRRTRTRVLRTKKVAIVVDASAPKGAKSEPLAVFVRTPEEKIFAGIFLMRSLHLVFVSRDFRVLFSQ